MERVPIDLRNKWFRLGLALAVVYAIFTAIVVVLLQFDFQLGFFAAIALSVIGAIALVVFVQFYFRHW